MAVAIFNGFFNVNVIRNNSNTCQGKNVNNAWAYYNKANFGVAQIDGNTNLVPFGSSINFDADAVDALMTNAGGQSPTTGAVAEVF